MEQYNAGETVQLPSNYGSDGFILGFQDHGVDPYLATPQDTNNPVSNTLVPVLFNELILSPEEVSAIDQTMRKQDLMTQLTPVSFTPPGPAQIGKVY